MKTYEIKKLDSGFVLSIEGWSRAFEDVKSLEVFLMAKFQETVNAVSAKSKTFSVSMEAKQIVE